MIYFHLQQKNLICPELIKTLKFCSLCTIALKLNCVLFCSIKGTNYKQNLKEKSNIPKYANHQQQHS